MFTKKHLILVTAGVVLATGAILTQTAASNQPPSNKLEGVWTASMPGTPFHWSYILAPIDPSSRRALIKGQFIVPIPADAVFPQLANEEYLSESWGEVEMTGADTSRGSAMWYGMKAGVSGPEIVNIGVTIFEGKFVAPGKLEMKHRMAFYSPNATGIVTEADTPFLVYPEVVTSVDTRMPILPASVLQK